MHEARGRYWANAETEELPGEMAERIQRYYDHLEATGRMEVWRRSARAYFGLDPDGGFKRSSAVTYGGEQGEIAQVRENHFRSLCQHIHVMATGERPAYRARAMRPTYQAEQQARLAERLLDYFFTEKELEDRASEASEMGILFGEGWFALTWDPNRGEEYAVREQEEETGEVDDSGAPLTRQRVVYQGDLVAESFHPIDVIRDPNQHVLQQRWFIVRRRVNRWDLMAQYPDLADDIRETGASNNTQHNRELFSAWRGDYGLEETDDDHVFVYELYHARTPSTPDGRHAQVVGDVVLFDGGLPYSEIPIYPMIPAVELQRGYGYSHVWDLLCLQEALDATASTALTNHDAFGVQNVAAPKGAGVSARTLIGGLNLVEYEQGFDAPEPLNLLQLDQATFTLLEHWRQTMELLSGVNSVARGDPEGSLKGSSGTALALVHSMALKFNSGIEKAHVRLLERAGTGVLELLKAFATTPRVAEIAGPDATPQLVSFTHDSIRDVRRVVVELGNAALRTTAGKIDVADKLADKFKDSPEPVTKTEYMEVMKTGRLEPIHRTAVDRALSIKQENEAIGRGEPPPVLKYENHPEHIRQHLELLESPMAKDDDQLVRSVQKQVEEHRYWWQHITMNEPEILQIMGIPPFPMPMGPQPGMGPAGPSQPGQAPPGQGPGPGGPPPQGGPPQGGPPQGGPPQQPQQPQQPRAQVPGADQMPAGALPQMPINPQTGQPFAPGGE